MKSNSDESLSDDSVVRFDLPGYHPDHLIYSSANSWVCRAVCEKDQRPVVLKVLRPGARPEESLRYKHEYEILRRLDGAGVVRAYGLEAYHNALFLILEDFGGASLDHWLKSRGRVGAAADYPFSRFFDMARRMVACIGQIHAAGITHKHITPANVVFNPDSEELKLIDLGLASALSWESPSPKSPQVLEGTLPYLSPEQTGRMNRAVDYRTDWYSLGVTFYEMLAGRLPFEASDAIEWVHCHLAMTPAALHVLNLSFPPVLSKLVLKLMAKAPEDRYQSAGGLDHDLALCEQHWLSAGSIPEFDLGVRDRAEHFLIPERLYGRDTEVEALLAAFERVARGHTELLLVTGLSGIGKTAVINEVHKPIVRQRGYFIRGKFDQFNRNIPFSGLVQAFRDLVEQVLSEGVSERQAWRTKILAALGESGQVIIDMIPELEQLIGPQPAVPELSGGAAQNRFNLLFLKFIAIFAALEHPLVVFLDDLQWADLASLQLLRLLVCHHSGYLLLLGAYRDNEVSPAHPLVSMIEDAKRAEAVITSLILTPLQLTDVNQLVADTLHCSPELALPLTQLIYQRTKGNPFFCHQFLRALYAEGLVAFDEEAGFWQCDLAQVSILALDENVVEFMAARLQALPRDTGEVLKLAACMGGQFDLETLAIVRQRSQADVAADLWLALQEGLVLPRKGVYTFFLDHGDELPRFAQADFQVPTYQFLHDRVQQAAYSLIPEAQRCSIHLSIGQLLLANTPEAEREERIFEIANQLNRGVALLTEPAVRRELAQLNLRAGQKARAATAFGAAWDYFTAGRQLLPEDAWQNHYELTLRLYESSVEAAYLSGHFAAMGELAGVVLAEARTLPDAVKVYEVKIQALAAQNKLLEAVHTGLQVLALLGVEFPEKPVPADIEKAVQETQLVYRGIGVAQLVNLPLMTDATLLVAMRILAHMMPVAFLSSPELFVLLTLRAVTLSVKYGNTPASTHAYAAYGIFLCGVAGEIEIGYQFGQLALSLLQRLNAREMHSRVHLIVYGFTTHWKTAVKDSLIPLQSAYYSGLETGDLEFTGYSAILYCAFAYYAGIEKKLSVLAQEVSVLSESVYQLKQMTAFQYLQMLQQVLHDVMEGRASSQYLKGDFYDEEQMLPVHLQANDRNGLFYLHSHKLLLSYLFEDYSQALEDAAQVEAHLDGGTGFPHIPVVCFYDSLTRLALYASFSRDEADEQLLRVEQNQEKMGKWAQHAPMNCQYKYDLVEAERWRVLGDKVRAMDYYERAVAGAQENDYLRDAALANELAAKFYLGLGREKVAQAYMQAAYEGYVHWGAAAKAAQLARRHDKLLALPLGRPHQAGTNGVQLDLLTVVKALQAIAGEIDLERLLKQMMCIVLENAGAQQGALLLEHDGKWVIEAQGEADGEIVVLQARDVRESETVSAAVVYEVARSRTAVVLDNAAYVGEFTGDASISRRGVKSVMCAPMLNQGQLSGIVYLENNLSTQVFALERLELLELLSTQMALSLDNARLYRQAQQEIAERKLTEHALRESEERFRAIFDSVNDAVFVLDLATGDILDVNRTMCVMYGYTREEALKLNLDDLSAGESPYSREEALAWMEKAVAAAPQVFEWRAKGKNERLFWVEVSMRQAMIRGQDRLLLTVRDITERKQTEEELRQNRLLTDALFESIPGLVYFYNQKGELVRWNKRHETETGYSFEELDHKNVWEWFLPDDADEQAIKEMRETIFELDYLASEAYLYKKDGQSAPYFFTTTLIHIDGEAYHAGIGLDITARKQAEEEREHLLKQIRESEQRIRQIMDTVPEGVLLLDSELRVAMCNPLARDYLVQLGEDVNVCAIRGLHSLGEYAVRELLTSPPRGLWHEIAINDRYFQVAARALESGSTMHGWVMVMHDVTKAHEVELRTQRQERLAAVGQLAAGIAHDFNNILATITLYSQMSLRIPDLSPKLTERLEIIAEQGRQASDLINQILGFSRTSSLDHRALDLVPLLKEQVGLLKRTLPENIRIHLDFGVDTYTIIADPTRIRQILMNLALNARDAMPGGGDLRFALERIEFVARKDAPLPDLSPGAWVCLSVADTGTGIPPEVLSRLGDPFFTTKSPGKGTGLGLAQVFSIVAFHEGVVDVKTEVGEGTAFVIYLPALSAFELTVDTVMNHELPLGYGEVILVVEDNLAARKALVSTLETLNYRVLAADNGIRALELFDQHREAIRLVLSDWVMPDMGGKALFHALQQRGFSVPLIILSGHPLESEAQALQHVGAAAWLKKPVGLEDLAKAVQQALKLTMRGDGI